MEKRIRVLVVVIVTILGVVVGTAPVGAKVLPYDLAVVGTKHKVRRPVHIVFHPHPDNVLGESFDWEVRWAKVRRHQSVAAVVHRRGKPVMMQRVAPDEYRGTVRPARAGIYVVYGRSAVNASAVGFPQPIRVRVR